MSCIEVQNNLVAFIHGELNKKTVIEIHRHLSGCEVCIQEEIELRKTNRFLDRYQLDALPGNFDAELHRKISEIDKPHQKGVGDFKRIVYAIAATIIIMIGIQFFGYKIMQSARQPACFVDFAATQAVFKPAEQRVEKQVSLKKRFIEKYLQSPQGKKIQLKRD